MVAGIESTARTSGSDPHSKKLHTAAQHSTSPAHLTVSHISMPFSVDTDINIPTQKVSFLSELNPTHQLQDFTPAAPNTLISPFKSLACMSLPPTFVKKDADTSASKSSLACVSLPFVFTEPGCKSPVEVTGKRAVSAGIERLIVKEHRSASACPSPLPYLYGGGLDVDALIAASLKKPVFEEAAFDELVNNGFGANGLADVPMASGSGDFGGITPAGVVAYALTAKDDASAPPVVVTGAVQSVLDCYGTVGIQSGTAAGIAEAANNFIAAAAPGDTFYVYDLGEVHRLYRTWRTTMPRVMPFYAVKCNPEPSILAMLNAMGCGFDCASVQELERAAALNVPQSRIIFANPCKRPADFRYAAEKGVEHTTFDCASELEKIAAGYPAFKCVLRIRCDDAEAKINLGLKYGAEDQDVPMLLQLAKDLGLQVSRCSITSHLVTMNTVTNVSCLFLLRFCL